MAKSSDTAVPVMVAYGLHGAYGYRNLLLHTLLPFVCGVLLLCNPTLKAQTVPGRWGYTQVTTGGYQKYSPQLSADPWGNHHIMWVSKDLNRSGFQIFYQNDATGRFSAPLQVTDIGSVIDSDTSLYNAFVFRLDTFGTAHVVFVANVNNYIHLYYTNNRQLDKSFAAPTDLGDHTVYDMAVDSNGMPHVVWLEPMGGVVAVRYWKGNGPGPRQIATVPCGTGCRTGDPQIEVRNGHVVIALRTSNGVYRIASADNGQSYAAPQSVQLPYNPATADLRLRMTIDSSLRTHIVAPYNNNLYYVTELDGDLNVGFLTAAALESNVIDFDIACNTYDRMVATWTTQKTSAAGSTPKTGCMEFVADASGGWTPFQMIADLAPRIIPPPPLNSYIRRAVVFGDRLGIVTLSPVATDSARVQVGLITRTALRPTLSYLHPDAAAAGMGVVVETMAPYREHGSFGPDGYHGDTVRLALANPADNARVVIGPSVVSWDGRMLSAMVFVKPGATPGPVPLLVRTGARLSNADTFFVVSPQHLGGESGGLAGGGVLGSGGIYGTRSRRGVLVVDSLVLHNGLFTVDTVDTDPETAGNQGFLPVTILSAGPVRIDSGATLSVSARHDTLSRVFGTAGPGGGGGGAGGQVYGAGSGFTGGGAPGRVSVNDPPSGATDGTGGSVSGWWVAGPSLNGTGGGATFVDAPAGGGTGHPFGSSGGFGQANRYTPVVRDQGSDGAGTAGSMSIVTGYTTGGGGGGYATAGADGDYLGDKLENNGGNVTGCRMLVPLAGGSGGGGGGYFTQGFAAGGGGGGAVSIVGYADVSISGNITADGADGITASAVSNNSGGGGGSGGAILLAAQGTLSVRGRLSASGGTGGGTSPDGIGRRGGSGGAGRIRIDGKCAVRSAGWSTPAPQYSGPATGISAGFPSVPGTVVRGTGMPGTTVRVLVRAANGTWAPHVPDNIVAQDSTWQVTLSDQEAMNEPLYVAAMQRVANPSRAGRTAEPDWVLSAAGANILGRAYAAFSADSVHFGCVRVRTCDTARVTLTNTGAFSDLIIKNVQLITAHPEAFAMPPAPLRIAAGTSETIDLYFCPRSVGTFTATLRVTTNAVTDPVRDIPVTACGTSGVLQTTGAMNLGGLCGAACRDTVLQLANTGPVALSVLSALSSSTNLTLQLPDNPLPLTIPAGSSVRLKVRACFTGFDTARVLVITDAADSVRTIIFNATDLQPQAALPAAVSFGVVSHGAADSCSQRSLTIRNLNAAAGLPVRSVRLTDTRFTLLNPPAPGYRIGVNDSLVLQLRFCGDTVNGNVAAALRIGFGDSLGCALDTVVALNASVKTAGQPVLVVVDPAGHDLPFPATLVNNVSPALHVVIRNLGTAPGVILKPALAGPGGGAFSVSLPYTAPDYPIAPGDSLVITVTMYPRSLGDQRDLLLLQNQDGTWKDSVALHGRGIAPGVQFNLLGIDFGEVRVGGQSAWQQIALFNSGTAPVRIDSVSNDDNVHFVQTAASHTFPHTLVPGTDTIYLSYRYDARDESVARGLLTIHSSPGQQFPATAMLGGAGVLEHIESNLTSVQFGCVPGGSTRDSAGVLRLTNQGSYPLTVTGLRVVLGGQWFSIPGGQVPAVIQPTDWHDYTVRFTAGSNFGQMQGRVHVDHSAPENLDIDLAGSVCVSTGGDDRTLTISAPDVQAKPGDGLMLPVLGRLDAALSGSLPYSFTLRYNYDLLAPRTDVIYPVVAGTISSMATMQETAPGQLLVTGYLLPGLTGDTLVKLPLRVLLGHRLYTDLRITDAVFPVAGVKAVMVNGKLQVYGCGGDTTGVLVNVAGRYALDQNLPNPFYDATMIRYQTGRDCHVRLNVYNSMGLMVKQLVDEDQKEGVHQITITRGALPSGIYTYELLCGPYRAVRRLVVID